MRFGDRFATDGIQLSRRHDYALTESWNDSRIENVLDWNAVDLHHVASYLSIVMPQICEHRLKGHRSRDLPVFGDREYTVGS